MKGDQYISEYFTWKKSSSWQFWRKQTMTLKTYSEPLVNTHHRKKTLTFTKVLKNACGKVAAQKEEEIGGEYKENSVN